MDKLTLEHLAPYLPYGLKVKYNRSVFYTRTVSVHISPVIKLERYHNHRYYNEVWLIEDTRFKPILRPLSDLTKEIKHKGCEIMPIDYISTSLQDSQRTMRRVANEQEIDVLDYWKVQRLCELHFDVFGLIAAGLAVDINTLEGGCR